jgi:hypothetical protein
MANHKAPRLPTQKEKEQLMECVTQNFYQRPSSADFQQQTDFVEQASIAVFDDYVTDCPGYAGKIMMVVWSGAPETNDVFIWDPTGELVMTNRDA